MLEEEDVVFSIEDNGEGMDASTIKKARQEFFTTKDRGKGSGLGLSLCCSIIEFHHGWMDINSVLSKGTIISIHLPIEKNVDRGVEQ